MARPATKTVKAKNKSISFDEKYLGMLNELEELADKNDRTLSAEVCRRLYESIQREKAS